MVADYLVRVGRRVAITFALQHAAGCMSARRAAGMGRDCEGMKAEQAAYVHSMQLAWEVSLSG